MWLSTRLGQEFLSSIRRIGEGLFAVADALKTKKDKEWPGDEFGIGDVVVVIDSRTGDVVASQDGHELAGARVSSDGTHVRITIPGFRLRVLP